MAYHSLKRLALPLSIFAQMDLLARTARENNHEMHERHKTRILEFRVFRRSFYGSGRRLFRAVLLHTDLGQPRCFERRIERSEIRRFQRGPARHHGGGGLPRCCDGPQLNCRRLHIGGLQ